MEKIDLAWFLVSAPLILWMIVLVIKKENKNEELNSENKKLSLELSIFRRAQLYNLNGRETSILQELVALHRNKANIEIEDQFLKIWDKTPENVKMAFEGFKEREMFLPEFV